MVSTEGFRTYQATIRDLYNILQDEIYPIVDKAVEDWDYYNRDEDGRITGEQNIDDMRDAVLPKLDELAEEIDRDVLNGVLKVIASFRLHRSFRYPGVGTDVKELRQLQLRKKAEVA